MRSRLPLLVLLLALVPTSEAAAVPTGLSGARWNPCTPITVGIDARGGYRGSTADVLHAVAVIARATGLRLVPVHHDAADADITISWSTPRQDRYLRGNVAGVTSTASARHDGVDELFGATIDLDRTTSIRRGFPASGSPSWGQVILHELGHAVGLTHVHDPTQVMAPRTSRSNHRLGSGDLRRLHRVGSAAGCIADSVRS